MLIPFTRNTEVLILPNERSIKDMPVILALHGMGQSAAQMRDMLATAIARGTHTWIIPDGPFPFEMRRTKGIGHAWYLYTGDQEALKASMFESVRHLDTVLDAVLGKESTRLLTVLGFSQGGYLGGVYGAARPERISAVCCAGGRLKHEFFPPAGVSDSEPSRRLTGPRFLQLHGAKDEAVLLEIATSAVEETKRKGYDVALRTFDAGHELTVEMLDAFLGWLGT